MHIQCNDEANHKLGYIVFHEWTSSSIMELSRRFSQHYQTTKTNVRVRYNIHLPELIFMVVYATGLVLFVGITIKDFLPLFYDYTYNNAVTNLEFIVPVTKIPNIQLIAMIPHYTLDRRAQEMLMKSSQYIFNGSHTTNCPDCEYIAAVCRQILTRMNISWMEFQTVDEVYNGCSLAFVHRLFVSDIAVARLENSTDNFHVAMYNALTNFFMLQNHMDESARSLDLGPRLNFSAVLRNIDIEKVKSKSDNLFSILIKWLCKDMTMFYDDIDQNGHNVQQKVQVNENMPVVLTISYMIMAVPMAPFAAITVQTTSFLFSNNNTSIWMPVNTGHYFPVYDDAFLLYSSDIDKMHRYLLKPVGRFVYTANSKTYATLTWTIESTFKDTREDSLCTKESPALCSAKCTKQVIIDQCKCVPFSYHWGLVYDAELPYCNEGHYTNCNSLITNDTFKVRCDDMCSYPCMYSYFIWKQEESVSQRSTPTVNKSQFGFVVERQYTFLPYLQFNADTKNSFEQFFSQVAGIVSLYLGWDGMTLCAVVVLVIRYVHIRFLRGKTSNEVVAELGAENAGTQWATRVDKP